MLYTLTNSLTGAGIGKYILPGVGVAVALVAVFGALGWVLRRRRHHPHHFGYSLVALVLALVVLGGGAYAYIKFIRPKQASKVSADPDDYDFADEEEYINEDEPEPEEEMEDTK